MKTTKNYVRSDDRIAYEVRDADTGVLIAVTYAYFADHASEIEACAALTREVSFILPYYLED